MIKRQGKTQKPPLMAQVVIIIKFIVVGLSLATERLSRPEAIEIEKNVLNLEQLLRTCQDVPNFITKKNLAGLSFITHIPVLSSCLTIEKYIENIYWDENDSCIG